MDPFEFTNVYEGVINQQKFYLVHQKSFSVSREEHSLSVQIIWEKTDVKDRVTLEEGIKKIFKLKLENKNDCACKKKSS